MVNQQGTEQAIIVPHYHWVQEEFIRLRDKLEAVFDAPSRPMGLEVVDGKAALKIWEQGLRNGARRLPSLLRFFSTTILARSRRPSRIHTQQALIPLAQEVNRLIALHRQLWQQPFCKDLREGQALLSRCVEKIAADLTDLFTFFIITVEEYGGEDAASSACHVWDREISCRAEMAAYKCWAAENVQAPSMPKGLLVLPRLLFEVIVGVESRGLFCRI